MNKDGPSQLDKHMEEQRRKARAAALRRKDEKYNEELRRKAMTHKEETGSFDGLQWGDKDSLNKIRDSFKGATDKGLFKELIKRLKD